MVLCSEVQASLAEGDTESHIDSTRLMSLGERDQPIKQRMEKSMPGRGNCFVKTWRLEKTWCIPALGDPRWAGGLGAAGWS